MTPEQYMKFINTPKEGGVSLFSSRARNCLLNGLGEHKAYMEYRARYGIKYDKVKCDLSCWSESDRNKYWEVYSDINNINNGDVSIVEEIIDLGIDIREFRGMGKKTLGEFMEVLSKVNK